MNPNTGQCANCAVYWAKIVELEEFRKKGEKLCEDYGLALIKIHDLESALKQCGEVLEKCKEWSTISIDGKKLCIGSIEKALSQWREIEEAGK